MEGGEREAKGRDLSMLSVSSIFVFNVASPGLNTKDSRKRVGRGDMSGERGEVGWRSLPESKRYIGVGGEGEREEESGWRREALDRKEISSSRCLPSLFLSFSLSFRFSS